MPVVDASVYVAIVNVKDSHHAVARRWLDNVLAAGDSLYAPNILMSEVAAAISRGVGEEQLVVETATQLSRSTLIELVPVSNTLAQRAAEIAARQRIRGCDSIYVALAESIGEGLLTFDQQQLSRACLIIPTQSP